MGDKIHKPDHYCFSKFEPKDVIREWGLNFNLGSAVKYIARAGRKDDIIQDLKKAKEFITFEIEALEAERARKRAPEHVNCRCSPHPHLSDIMRMSPKEFLDCYKGNYPKILKGAYGINFVVSGIDVYPGQIVKLTLNRTGYPFSQIVIELREGMKDESFKSWL